MAEANFMESQKMIRIERKTECSGCYACYSVCPVNCIRMESDAEGFWYPIADATRCIGCGACEAACHIIHKYEPSRSPVAYAAYAKDEVTRRESSSGGLFTPICEAVIKDGGVVFGAAFDEDFQVHHIKIADAADIKIFRGSKYVQSKIGETYLEVKALLSQGRKVLFSGTPCQIAGLRQFLKSDDENLILVDIICHGVPSPKVWAVYKDFVEKSKKDRITAVNFRDKAKGWRLFSLKLRFSKGFEQGKTLDDDPYMFGFLRNIFLRPSCYACVEKSLNRKSDMTIADYWGIEHVHPEFSDDKGISLVFVNTPKGEELFERIKPQLNWIETDILDGAAQNPASEHSAVMSGKREAFFEALEEKNAGWVFHTFCREDKKPLAQKKRDQLIKRVKNIAKKLIEYRRRLIRK